jgi:hypothetical protein
MLKIHPLCFDLSMYVMYTEYIMAQPELIPIHTRLTPAEIDEIDRQRLLLPYKPSRAAFAAGLVRRQLGLERVDPVASCSEDNSGAPAGSPK